MTKTAFKQGLRTAKTVRVVNLNYPELSGDRELVKAQSNAVSLRLPVDHPRYAEVKGGSWTYFNPTDRMEDDWYVVIDPNTSAQIAKFQIID